MCWNIIINKYVEDYLASINDKEYIELRARVMKRKDKWHSIIVVSGDWKQLVLNQKELRSNVIFQTDYKTHRIHSLPFKNDLYLLHAFRKKTQKTPDKDLKTTISRANFIIKDN